MAVNIPRDFQSIKSNVAPPGQVSPQPPPPQVPPHVTIPSSLEQVFRATESNFPGLWRYVDISLSTFATLFLKDSDDPVALILVGPPSSSKTTIARMFAEHPLSYLSDKFTPASFVSNAANVSKEKLKDVHLLPRIKHKLLLTPELAPVLRGKEDELTNRFAIITRVLDGQGLATDSGTHGRQNLHGDYRFAWLGCTTPLDDKVFRIMAQLGSRLLFAEMPEEDISVDDLLKSRRGVSFRQKVETLTLEVTKFMNVLCEVYGIPFSVDWDSEQDDENAWVWISHLAKLLALMRGEAARESKPNQGIDYRPARIEQPYRAFSVLGNLACGHALVHGRRALTMDDIPPVAHVVFSTMPPKFSRLFKALILKGGKPLTVVEARAALGARHLDTARNVMRGLNGLGVMTFIEKGIGAAGELRFLTEWEWCGKPELQATLLGTYQKPGGV